MSEEEIKSMFDSIPKVETNNCISAYGSVDIEDIKSAMKRLNKVPNYNDLLIENKELKDNYCNRTDCSSRIKDSKKYDSLQQRMDKLQQENKHLKEMVKEIKQFCLDEQIPEENYEYDSYIEFSNSAYDRIYEKIEELEVENE